MLYRVEPVNPPSYVKNDYYNDLDWSNSQNKPDKDSYMRKSFSDFFSEAISKSTSNNDDGNNNCYND